jgi:hypothetical protein
MVGGGLGTATVLYKSEDIGTIGDLVFNEGEYLAMNRERSKDAKSDAIRQLYNKLKLGSELAFPIIPTIVAGGRIGNLILKKGKVLEYSANKWERVVDKWFSKPFRARGPFELLGLKRSSSSKRFTKPFVDFSFPLVSTIF